MSPIHVEAIIESDGILHIANLPCRRGDHVEATIVLSQQNESSSRQAAQSAVLDPCSSVEFPVVHRLSNPRRVA